MRIGPAQQVLSSIYFTQHFVAGTTARMATALCEFNRKTAAYYFHRLLWRLNWKPKARRNLTVRSKLTRVTLAATGRAIGDGVAGKTPVFGLLNRGGRVYTRIIPDASSGQLCFRSWRIRLCLTASSIAMVGGATTCLMRRTSITSRSSIENYSPTSKTTSTGLRVSATRRSA